MHFTVTRPLEHDVVAKGSYYHAQPEDVSRSYPHHHEHHYYEVERVPVHHYGHHSDYDYPVHHVYGEDVHPHFDEEVHTYSGEAVGHYPAEHGHLHHHEPAGYLVDDPHYEVKHVVHHQYHHAPIAVEEHHAIEAKHLHHAHAHVHSADIFDELPIQGDPQRGEPVHYSRHAYQNAGVADHEAEEVNHSRHHYEETPYIEYSTHVDYDDPVYYGEHGHHKVVRRHHYAHHSEEPLTHSEEYYYGEKISHMHEDDYYTHVAHMESCWKRASGRTLGKPMADCPHGMERHGAVCYPICKDGYYGHEAICM